MPSRPAELKGRRPKRPLSVYCPPEDVRLGYRYPSAHHTWCEWKGEACY